jgi:predicted RNA binding protein YcfA (HicA-like mRNA interferase family)
MQNMKTKDLQRKLSDKGYKVVRKCGSHTVYEKVVKDTVSVPTSSSEVNGCLAKKIEKQINNFCEATQ